MTHLPVATLILLLAAGVRCETTAPQLILGERNVRLGELYRGPAAISPDGRRALAAALDGRIELLDIESRRVKSSHRPPFEAETIEFLGNDRLIGSGKKGLVASWDAETGGSSVTLRLSGEEHHLPVASWDGRRVAFYDQQGVITVIDAATGKKITDLGRPNEDFYRRPWLIALSSDGRKAASGDWIGNIDFWNVDTAKIVWSTRAFSGHQEMVSHGAAGAHYGSPDTVVSFAFSPNGRLLGAAGSKGELIVFDTASGNLASKGSTAGPEAYALTFHPDGRSLFAGDRQGGLKRMGSHSGRDFFAISGKAGYSSLSISTDGLRIVALEKDRMVTVRDARTGLALGTGTTRVVRRVEYSRDGSLLAAGGDDGVVEIYAMPRGERLLRFKAHLESVRMLAFSPDASRIATIGYDGRLRVWKTASGEKLWEGPVVGISFAQRFAFAPDGKILITGDEKGMVVWNARSGKRLKEFGGHPMDVEDIAISANGRYAASGGGDARIRLWDIRSGKKLFEQPAVATPYSWTADISFTPDGRQVVGRDRNGNKFFRLSVPDGRVIETIRLDHNVRETILLADGRLAVSEDDNMLSRWTAYLLGPKGERKYIFRDRPGIGVMVAISPDGKQLVTAGDDGLLRVWIVPP